MMAKYVIPSVEIKQRKNSVTVAISCCNEATAMKQKLLSSCAITDVVTIVLVTLVVVAVAAFYFNEVTAMTSNDLYFST